MAFYLTYDTLTEQIKEFIQRDDADIIASIPMFIMLGERRVSRDLNILGLLKFVTGDMIPESQVLNKPDVRWLKTSSFFVGYDQLNQETGTFNSRKPVLNRENSFIMNYWPDPTQMGLPVYYGDFEYNYFILAPTPDQAYPFTISYYQVPELLDSTVSTNFLTNYDQDILLAASLIYAFMRLKNFTYAQEWEKTYANALQSMGILNDNLTRDALDVRGS